MNVELALPVANWQNKSSNERTQDIASALLEFQRQPNVYWTTPDQLIRLTDTNKDSDLVYKSETTATYEEIRWILESDAECLVWISPAKEGFYKCARVVLKKKYEGGKRILNIAVCLPIDYQHCKRLYTAFAGINFAEIDDQDFRDRPVEFNLPEGKTLDNLVIKLSGKSIYELMQAKTIALQDANEIEKKKSKEIDTANTLFEQIVVGASIEQEMIAKQYLINQFDDCPGKLNSQILNELKNTKVLARNPDRYEYNKFAHCRRCGQEKWVADCKICRDCQILYDNEELGAAA